jgi:hypothetical protein
MVIIVQALKVQGKAENFKIILLFDVEFFPGTFKDPIPPNAYLNSVTLRFASP